MRKRKDGPSTRQKDAYLHRLLDALNQANQADARAFITQALGEDPGLRRDKAEEVGSAIVRRFADL